MIANRSVVAKTQTRNERIVRTFELIVPIGKANKGQESVPVCWWAKGETRGNVSPNSGCLPNSGTIYNSGMAPEPAGLR